MGGRTLTFVMPRIGSGRVAQIEFDFTMYPNTLYVQLITVPTEMRRLRVFPRALKVALHSATTLGMKVEQIRLTAEHFRGGELPPHPYYVGKMGFEVDPNKYGFPVFGLGPGQHDELRLFFQSLLGRRDTEVEYTSEMSKFKRGWDLLWKIHKDNENPETAKQLMKDLQERTRTEDNAFYPFLYWDAADTRMTLRNVDGKWPERFEQILNSVELEAF